MSEHQSGLVEGEQKQFAAERFLVNGVLLIGNKVVIPSAMRREMLLQLQQW